LKLLSARIVTNLTDIPASCATASGHIQMVIPAVAEQCFAYHRIRDRENFMKFLATIAESDTEQLITFLAGNIC
jgi:hypothetical protein